MRILVAVMHYNRGDYLANCMASIQRHLPDHDVLIMDDDSDDPRTVKFLKELSKKFEVVAQHAPGTDEVRTGGLYPNMTFVMREADARGYDAVLFIQEDMQMVRSLSQEDFQVFEETFARPNASHVLQTVFLRALYRDRDIQPNCFRRISPNLFERRGKTEMELTSFLATGLFHVASFNEQLAKFKLTERENDAALRLQGKKTAWMQAPFMHWLPFPISFRARKRSLRKSLFDKIGGAGVHPITDMDLASIDRLKYMPLEVPAFAEDWLHAPSAGDFKYWSMAGGRSNLKARKGWREALERIL